MASASDAVPVGTLPPVGEIPSRMFAQLVRQDRFGDPRTAFQVEEVDTPTPGPGEVLIAVMASGINFNNVWAARGMPVDVIAQRQRGGDPNDFHLGGSDASGIVYAVGAGVERVAVGDEVIVHPGWWKHDDPWIVAGKDPMIAPSARIWGYDHDRNFGSFGQFAVAQEHQVLPKAEPPHVGGGRRIDARRHDRAADALRLGRQHRAEGRRRARLGWLRWSRQPGDPARRARRRHSRRGRLERRQG